MRSSVSAPTYELRDSWGRTAHDLRISLTDRCNLRCSYCMPPEGLSWLPTEETLTNDEVNRLVKIAVELLGINKIRFTGGEPLLRKNLDAIIAFAHGLETVDGTAPDLALTTNALSLDKHAHALAAAGLNRVNISLDSIEPQTYAHIAHRDRLADVFRGIDVALDAGLTPVKLNAVALRGANEDGLNDLLLFALRRGLQLRIIEQMPLGPRETWSRSNMVPEEEILEIFSQKFELTPAQHGPHSPARLWNVAGSADHPAGQVGIIASVTHPFCGTCDRTRLTADGQMRTCLFGNVETDLRTPLRAGTTDDEIAALWRDAMALKKPGHGIDDPSFVQPQRYMSEIGG
ncbi:GTP 3',8-cyclase MoaA [Arcanobacterium bovis]|uniref:GTP 3',8-cyclase MoaA n=1 Tax=Arcanobacterium bovis TaxID=2529275 RepID=UPI0019D52158|nr:GTP 3',8-cyclase MoaA [Arcanobacterium bovis]